MILRGLLLVWIAACIVLAFTWAPLVPVLAETTRVLYFHIPSAWITVVALGWSMVASIFYLRTRNLAFDDHAGTAAELGTLFAVSAAVTGSLWAKAMWGAYWNWDPRETSIFFLLLLYVAYLAIRGAIEEPEKRARLSAIYSVIAFVAVPFLMFVVPRLYDTLHPDPIINTRGKVDMDPRIRWTFTGMLVGFTALFYWMLTLRVRVLRLQRRRDEAEMAREGARA